MIIVDTSVWVDCLRGNHTWQAGWLKENLSGPFLGLTDLTYCEILQGPKADEDFLLLRDLLQQNK